MERSYLHVCTKPNMDIGMITIKYEVEVFFEENADGTVCKQVEELLKRYPATRSATLHVSDRHTPFVTMLCRYPSQAREAEENLVDRIKKMGGTIVEEEDE